MDRSRLRDFWKLAEEDELSLRRLFPHLRPDGKPIAVVQVQLCDQQAAYLKIICKSPACWHLPLLPATQTFWVVELARLDFCIPQRFTRSDGSEIRIERFASAWLGQCERCGQIILAVPPDPTA
jgi:hypothetical protein